MFVVRQTLWQCWQKKLFNFTFSLFQRLRTSRAKVVCQMTTRKGATMLKNSRKTSCSTIRKESSNATNNLTSAIQHASWSAMEEEEGVMVVEEESDFCLLLMMPDFFLHLSKWVCMTVVPLLYLIKAPQCRHLAWDKGLGSVNLSKRSHAVDWF